MTIHPERLFPAEVGAQKIAKTLYERMRTLLNFSPHAVFLSTDCYSALWILRLFRHYRKPTTHPTFTSVELSYIYQGAAMETDAYFLALPILRLLAPGLKKVEFTA
jgi:hypothetical protein